MWLTQRVSYEIINASFSDGPAFIPEVINEHSNFSDNEC